MKRSRRCRFLCRLLLWLAIGSSLAPAQYFLGPRGGCYTISASGRKNYVDRSMCAVRPSRAQTSTNAARAGAPEGEAGKFIRGPRGGCYALSPTGRKQYVDRSMCTQSEVRPRSLSEIAGEPRDESGSGRFIRGPRGGCYTLSNSGAKRYVDRSMCE
jgi:hypothetical protein